MDEIENMLTYMFQSVFVQSTEIHFQKYGLYVCQKLTLYDNWTLYDKVSEVGLKFLQALQSIYASEEVKTKLEVFASKFKDCLLVAMTLNKKYDVVSLVETNQMMKDWECMTDLLIQKPREDEKPLDNQQETSLIEIMVCCLKQIYNWKSLCWLRSN